MKSTEIDRAKKLIDEYNTTKKKLNELQIASVVVELQVPNSHRSVVYLNQAQQNEVKLICEEALENKITDLKRKAAQIGLTLI